MTPQIAAGTSSEAVGDFTDFTDLTVVIPLYNERDNIEPAVAELLDVLDSMPQQAEVLLVDDGSTDGTSERAFDCAARDARIRVIQFRRNFGQTAAIQAGFEHARGRVVILMDGDQQNDPRDIPMLLDKMAEGYDVVSGWRKDRQDRALSRKLPSYLANRLISRITGTRLQDYGCTLKAYDADVVRHLSLYSDMHRFIPALASKAGARVIEVPVNHRARTRGESKYGIGRAPRVVLDLVTVKFVLSYISRPMRLFGGFGLITFALSVACLVGLVAEKVIYQHGLANRPLLIIAGIAAIVGAQFMFMGLLGELLTRIYYESGSASRYVIRRTSDDPAIAAADSRLGHAQTNGSAVPRTPSRRPAEVV